MIARRGMALLATLVMIFAFQADNLTGRFFHVVLIAIPLLIQVYFNSGLTYGLMKWLKVPHNIAAPGALIGASNFFELAVAVAITLFGASSGAALASHTTPLPATIPAGRIPASSGSPTGSSVAGSITSKRWPSEDLRHLPPIQRSVGTLARRFSYIGLSFCLVSRARRSAKRCAAEPGPIFCVTSMGPGSAEQREERCTASGTRPFRTDCS